jgi:dienelactone hydrolase
MKVPHPDRRRLLKQVAAGSVWAGLGGGSAFATASSASTDPSSPMNPDELRARLLECLGGPWPESGPLNVRHRETLAGDGFRIESLTYEATSGLPGKPADAIPALLLIPDGVDAAHPAPAVAVWHQHNGEWHIGKSEPAGLAGNPAQHTGAALAREGYVVLCADAQCFEERQDPSGKLKGGNFERFEFLRYLLRGKCMAWKNILDMRRAVDFLVSRPEVEAGRIGCYGHSMGSTHTWLVGPFEPRLKALVGNCCLPTYAAIESHGLLHCFPNFVPGWLQYGDTPEIAALTAPRALHLNLGEEDGGSPIAEAREGIARISATYAAAGAADRFGSFVEPGIGHELSEAMWGKTKDWFARYLRA